MHSRVGVWEPVPTVVWFPNAGGKLRKGEGGWHRWGDFASLFPPGVRVLTNDSRWQARRRTESEVDIRRKRDRTPGNLRRKEGIKLPADPGQSSRCRVIGSKKIFVFGFLLFLKV